MEIYIPEELQEINDLTKKVLYLINELVEDKDFTTKDAIKISISAYQCVSDSLPVDEYSFFPQHP